jgi:hypothetical protein
MKKEFIIAIGLVFLLAGMATGAPNTGGGGGGGVGATNEIVQGDSSVVVADVGVGTVSTKIDNVEFFKADGATDSVTIGVSGGGAITANTNVVVNGTVTSDLFVSTADNGERGHSFVQNTLPHVCQTVASQNGFDIYADSSGSLNDIPLLCDDAGVVSQIVTNTPPLTGDSYRHKRLNNITSSTTLLAADFRDGVITNQGAGAGQVIITLPTPTVAGFGGSVCIMDTDSSSQSIRVTPDIASTIRSQSALDVAVAGQSFDTVNSFATLCLISIDATNWMVWQRKGTWTLVP